MFKYKDIGYKTGKKVIKTSFSGKKERQRKITVIFAAVIAFFFLIFGGIFAYYAKDLPSPNRVNSRNIEESTKIYDRTGEILLYEVHGDVKRTLIPLNEMSEHVREATISAEDKYFYRHFGFDPSGVTRALFRNVKKGNELQGGSTITQQLVKNSVLSPEKTFTRKIKELILSVEIELIYSKKDILQMYLNEIPYGSSAYGIESAAQAFFGKKAKDLTLAEAALLASLPKAPTYYSPFGANTDALKARQEWVLERMVEDEFITQEEANSAKKQELVYIEKREGIIAPHFVMYVKDQLVEKFGEKKVQEGGFKVYTTLDMNLQKIAEQTVVEGVDKNASYNAGNAALVAINPKDGEILAMQGSKDYWDKDNDGNVNVAIRYRQPGSSFKPFAYAMAFEKGYTPDTILFDVVTDFGNNYKPEDFDRKTRGPVTMRTALSNSLNIPAVKTLYLAGLNDTIDLAKKMGITTLNDPDRYGLSLVLGGGEVKLLEETAAYSVFANDGKKNDKKAILKILDKKGKIIEENTSSQEEKVLDNQIVRQISSILSDKNARSMVFGYTPNLSLGDRPVAVKTGTTEEFRDAWTVGYTPSLVAGVWVGNNDNSPMNAGADGADVAAPIWHNFMEKALEGKEIEEFPNYDPIKVDKPVLQGKSVVEKTVKIEKTTKKLATDSCPAEDVEEKTFRSAHCILFYVNKDDPRGPDPKNPAEDPQYNSWESAVQGWANKDTEGMQMPTETTDVCNPDKKPNITITSPSNGDLIKEGSVSLTASVKAPNGVKSVDYFVDGSQIGSSSSSPYAVSFIVSQFDSGSHTITARVTDKIGFKAENSISITTKVDRVSSVSFSTSGSGNLTKENFPLSATASVSYSGNLDKVQIFLNDSIVQEFSSPSGSSFSTQVSYPGPGTYSMYAAAVDENGRAVFSNRVSFNIAAESSPGKKKSSFLWQIFQIVYKGFNYQFS